MLPAGAQINADGQTVQGQGNDTGEPQNGAESPEGEYKPPREQRYRLERNEARALVEALQTREVERLAGDLLSQPGDLLELGGVSLPDLLTEAGHVDSEAVAEAAAALIAARPGLAKNPKDRPCGHVTGHRKQQAR